jgi:hypothetical protein
MAKGDCNPERNALGGRFIQRADGVDSGFALRAPRNDNTVD